MDFDFTDEQRMLKDSVDRLVKDEYGFEQRAKYLAEPDGFSRELWVRYADMGLLGLSFDEEYGGSHCGPVETMIVMEALGRALAVEPYLATVVLGGGLVRLGGNAAQRAAILPQIAQGELQMAFAHSEAQARYDLADVATTARREAAGWVLDGAKRVVLHGGSADLLVVSARVSGGRRERDGIGLFVVRADAEGVTRHPYPTQDRLRAADIQLSGVRVPDSDVLGTAGAALPLIERVVAHAIAAVSAEAVGAMAAAHEETVEYLKVRKQFGVPIGSFQALQHRAVDMLVMVEQARSMALFATMMSEEPDAAERDRSMSAAKVQIGRSGRFVGQQGVQLHGGIGMTEECKIGHYLRRLSVIDIQFGSTEHHLTQLANAGGLIDAAA
ncbi:pimeloyl-CoA dehydrogenase small subunit [Paraburkholderia sp. HC6.4b]|uniref:acyl-CoA dehydrogenase family protein n=1 Tax=unclassified Paraburkholderia TaxID=2615204 RepID=UPI00160A2126|nr:MULTISPECIES: acyl-CoA dehydrogenase family protein [unclassified Paraburkholderia]MBB5410331.1 pimeloyl-CoA dehydrogenase small subunit [Paraburkholderia sp. HC6.4b]MBB5452540.1 pimeloyl-CoA dehydrogenase small subunit [Paraburkholderia sp. Kb1A]